MTWLRMAPTVDRLVTFETTAKTSVELAPIALSGRGDRIRTCDLLVPNQALYQTKLHPATSSMGGGRSLHVNVLVDPLTDEWSGFLWMYIMVL